MKLNKPFHGNYPITQCYGDSITEAFHPGIDYALPVGVPVLAVADGVVVDTKVQINGYGNYVRIQHGVNAKSLYAHLFKWLVKEGQHVTAGMVIGYSGNSGNSTGPHLHFEYWVDGKHVDPERYFDQAITQEYEKPAPAIYTERVDTTNFKRIRVIGKRVAVRSYPGLQAPIHRRVNPGDVLLAIDTVKQADGLNWQMCFLPVYIAEHDGENQLIENIKE